MEKVSVYLESGQKRVFACALSWPGWCRSGRDEASALQALLDYGPRYLAIVEGAGSGFEAPADTSQFAIAERLTGNATTDFGAPDVTPSTDIRPLESADLERYRTLLEAYWRAFDAAVSKAEGRELRKGPRGGGRDLEAVVRHVIGADASYLSRLAYPFRIDEERDLRIELDRVRGATLDALGIAARGEMPLSGPRGGALWSPHYFVRRTSWHLLDHLWEIEDRVV
jgi:hypothetical protein